MLWLSALLVAAISLLYAAPRPLPGPDAPQPYGELFVMRYDGTHVQQLTDNQWEDGGPAWQPTPQRQ